MSVFNLGKKTPNYCQHISNCHVIPARLHTTCNDPTETLQLNEHPVTGLLYSGAAQHSGNFWPTLYYRPVHVSHRV